jgi:hypothetical protein
MTRVDMAFESFARPHSVVRTHDDCAHPVERLDECEPPLRSEYEHGVVDLVGE